MCIQDVQGDCLTLLCRLFVDFHTLKVLPSAYPKFLLLQFRFPFSSAALAGGRAKGPLGKNQSYTHEDFQRSCSTMPQLSFLEGHSFGALTSTPFHLLLFFTDVVESETLGRVGNAGFRKDHLILYFGL